MTPESLHDLFVAAAGVAGALIGLLFVAISIEHERLTAQDAAQVHRIRASAALSAFTNALTVSLFALVPDEQLGGTAFVVGVLGLAFVVASLLSVRRARRTQTVAARELTFLSAQLITCALQIVFGLQLAMHSHAHGAADGIAILVIVCFLIGIARSWELIGGPEIGLGHEVKEIVTHRREDPGADQQPQDER